VLLYAFDLLALNGRDLRQEPIEARKAEFAGVLEHNSGVVFVKVLAQMQAGLGAADQRRQGDVSLDALRLEVVSKRQGSRYVSGRSRRWGQLKLPE